MSCRIEASTEEAGNPSVKLTATSSLEDDLGCCQYEKRVSLDLSNNRGIGLWICGDGKGEILNLQLKSVVDGEYGHMERLCDHCVVADFEGWSYREIPEPEGERIFEYFKHTKDYYHMAAHGSIIRK